MTTRDNLTLTASLINARGWDTALRALMLAGKHLPTLDSELRTDANKVSGCDSQVWISCDPAQPGRFVAFSDSKVIRGVLAIILEQLHALPVAQQRDFDYDTFLNECGLSRYLSQSRNNGIGFVIKRLKMLTAVV